MLRLHLEELRRRYLDASQRAKTALRDRDLDAFGSILREKEDIHEEWMSVLDSYFQNYVRLRKPGAGAGRKPGPQEPR
jgi:hypothetical protein